MQKSAETANASHRPSRFRWGLILAVTGALILAGLFIFRDGGKSDAAIPTFAAKRGLLEITVLEGGSLQALEFQEIKCEVRVGYQGTKILKIVEEGYLVTEEDVRTNKVLVELDSSELEKQIVQQEIQYQSAVASLTDAEQNYEIQLNQNASDIKAAEQKARFARMDFDKFLGDTVTAEIIVQLGLDQLLAAASTNNVEATLHADEATMAQPRPQPPPNSPTMPVTKPMVVHTDGPVLASVISIAQPPPITPPPSAAADIEESPAAPIATLAFDFAKYADIEVLGDGEAKQKLRKFEDDLQVAQKELGQSKATLEGTGRLFDKGFVTRTDLQRDELAYENSRLKVQTAETASALFLKYEFTKSAEESLSKYAEAVRELDKARRLAISKLAQARAKLKSAQGQFGVQTRQKKDLAEQLEKCTLPAKKAGLVVYGANRDDMMFYGGEERIREGAAVRERQTIITIPDTTRMSVNVKIHESYIKKVQRGLKARITVDAFPDEVLTGEVTKVGVLPDSQNRWMNPDMKVYLTTIAIDGTHDWVKPGMSAKVEILVNRLDDVVYVPVQAVSPGDGKHLCYVAHGLKPEQRVVEVGQFNDEFIEIKSGLAEGERVLLRTPGGAEAGETVKDRTPREEEKDKAPEPTAPTATATKAGKA
ncbi:MAG: HlyD family efflux transporter periplasmic adaptor subunit [Verrucomicrobia bacterium]|nr:HlyD family efflux transporter periplasmic adaptor subunit [Verrucomicrobiota bacterium]